MIDETKIITSRGSSLFYDNLPVAVKSVLRFISEPYGKVCNGTISALFAHTLAGSNHLTRAKDALKCTQTQIFEDSTNASLVPSLVRSAVSDLSALFNFLENATAVSGGSGINHPT